MKRARYVTFIMHRDGSLNSRTVRIPLWALRSLSVLAIAFGAVLIIVLALYGPIVRAAAQVPLLKREIARLNQENVQVRRLARALESMERRYALVRGMLGGSVLPNQTPVGEVLPSAHPLQAQQVGVASYVTTPTLPKYWPLDEPGVVTRGQVGTGGENESHPGIDVAVPTGTPIRASAGGDVADAGRDPEYGLFVLLRHPEGYETMYGHASRILVTGGVTVSAGQVIALSGSTGRSTAPHLHFEVRHNGQSIDPRSVIPREAQP
jgi:murein DD-endopeptidase MepM/ murein hydrolase activator NlpD